MTDWLNLYHRLPPFARSLLATAHGYRLRRRRYGAETDGLVEQALARESWSEEQWAAWQAERLERLLERAAVTVPYYRRHWEARRRTGDRASSRYLENWPVLEKEELRRDPRAFIADDCDPDRMINVHTSGTTGKPLNTWRSLDTEQEWYALYEARARRWYGVSRHTRWAILGGQLVAPVQQRKPPFWVWNAGLRQLYLSSYHLAPDLIGYYLDALKQHQIKYLLGYTSALYELAQQALISGRDDLGMQVVVTNAEPVYAYQRRTIEAAFDCPVRETYGMAEIVAAASECESNRMHLWPEVGVVEVDRERPDEEGGDLLCTGLINNDMPLIRYRVGDAGTIIESNRCGCGRSLPWSLTVEGRNDDLLFTADGRRVGRLDPVFKADLPVREAQIVQESFERLRVLLVPAPGYDEAAGKALVGKLKARMGDIEVVLQPVEKVPRTANGKFRAVICQIPPEVLSKRNATGRER